MTFRYNGKLNLWGIWKIACLIAMLLSTISFSVQANDGSQLNYLYSHFRLIQGENRAEKTASIVSTDWPEFDRQIRATDINTIYWLVWDVDLIANQDPLHDLEFYLSLVGSYEVYWDGQLAHKNGLVSDSPEHEIPGAIQSAFLLPSDWVKPGQHEIAIKISSHFRYPGQQIIRHAYLKHYDMHSRFTSLGSLIPSLALSISLIIGIYFLTLFASDKLNYSYIVFGFLCFSLFVYGMGGESPHLIGYTYDWHVYKEVTVALAGILFALLLPLFFLLKYKQNKWWLWLLMMPVVAYGIDFFVDIKFGNGLFWAIGFAFSILIMLKVIVFSGGRFWWELLGLLACFIGILFNWNDLENFFLVFPLLVFFVLLSNVVQAQRDRYNGMIVQIKASQLETQLLRRNIQPHFILNSLASIIELVETAPEKSIDFISALADEFRLFSEIANKPYIKLEQEIELCNTHLEIMGFRYQRHYILDCSGIKNSDNIPTGILHTLLENAFSHNDYSSTDLSFRLSKENAAGYIHLSFSAPLRKITNTKFSRLNTGMGLNFVTSQLNQCCGNKWTLASEKLDEHWVSKVIYPEI